MSPISAISVAAVDGPEGVRCFSDSYNASVDVIAPKIAKSAASPSSELAGTPTR